MERMSTQDAGFYFVEDENSPMHVGSVAVFEGPPPAYGDLVRLLVAKLPRVPRYRQRVRTVPLHLGRPMWIDDEHFEILYHVRHTAVPAPGGEEQLRNLAGRVFAQRLDTAKPLWEMWLVEGLQGGRWAIISKVHHCMIDGVAGWDLAALLLDTAPEPEPLPAGKAWRPRPAPSTAWLIADGLRDAVLEPLQQLARVPTLARNLPTRQEILDFGRGLPTSARRLVSPSARSLNGPTGPHRRWEWTQESLGEVKLIRKAVGGTVNDVVLTAITRGFRDLLAGRGELVDGQVVRSMVPVSVRAEEERGTLNNRVSAVLVNLPVGETDPLARLAKVREQMDDQEQPPGGQRPGAHRARRVRRADLAGPGHPDGVPVPATAGANRHDQRARSASPAVHAGPADGRDPSVRADRQQHADLDRHLLLSRPAQLRHQRRLRRGTRHRGAPPGHRRGLQGAGGAGDATRRVGQRPRHGHPSGQGRAATTGQAAVGKPPASRVSATGDVSSEVSSTCRRRTGSIMLPPIAARSCGPGVSTVTLVPAARTLRTSTSSAAVIRRRNSRSRRMAGWRGRSIS